MSYPKCLHVQKLMLSFLCLFVCACAEKGAGNGAAERGKGSMDTAVMNVITFKVDGAEVKTAGWNIARFKFYNMAAPGLNITSNMHEEKRTIRINLNGYHIGTYPLDGSPQEGGSYGSYMPDYWKKGSAYPITGGSVTLTEVDTVRKVVNGTFSFTAKGRNDTIVTITDGRIINGKLDLGISGVGK